MKLLAFIKKHIGLLIIVVSILIAVVLANPCIFTGHAYGDGIETKTATCTEKGTIEYICSKCRHSYIKEIPINTDVHNWGEYKTIKKGSGCSNYGKEARSCKDCGKTDSRKTEPPLKHSGSNWVYKGCVDSDFKYTGTCTRCGKKVSKYEPRPMEKCIVCNGTGYVRYYYGESDLEAYLTGHDPYTVGECTSCDGEGEALANRP